MAEKKMNPPPDTGLHGISVDSPWLKTLINITNRGRYDLDEDERMAATNALNERAIPGITQAAYPGELKIYDPASAERYGSAYLFGKKWPRLTGLAKLLTKLRGAGAAIHFPGMGPEREELIRSQEMGLALGRQHGLERAGKLLTPPEIRDMEERSSRFRQFGPDGTTKKDITNMVAEEPYQPSEDRTKGWRKYI